MSKLLSTFSEIILPILIILLAIGVAVIVYFRTKKKFDKIGFNPAISVKQSTPQVKLKERYCTEQEMIFLEALHKSLPRDCIAFPNVGVSNLIEPKGNLIDYKSVLNKYVDVCVFLRKDMKPILVIDLFQPSPAAQQMKKFDDNVLGVLKEVKIPVLHKQIENSYNIENLRVELLQSMSNTTVAYLKEKIINDVKKHH